MPLVVVTIRSPAGGWSPLQGDSLIGSLLV
jgi:hypothetical protein